MTDSVILGLSDLVHTPSDGNPLPLMDKGTPEITWHWSIGSADVIGDFALIESLEGGVECLG